MVGGVLSTLFTLNVQVDVLLAASVAVNVTTVVPTPETAVPAAGDCVIIILAAVVQLSDFVASDL